MSENPPIADLFYGDEEDPSIWFTKFQRMLPHSWTEPQKTLHFFHHIAPGSFASEWYTSLRSGERATLSAIATAFSTRWPVQERPKFSRAEQMERIKAQVLEEENIGKWTTPSEKHRADYGQNIWANAVAKEAISMGDNAGFLIEYAVDGIPDILKDHLQCRYNTWEEFRKDIRTVPLQKIQRGRSLAMMQRTQAAEIAYLQAQIAEIPHIRAQAAANAAALQTANTHLAQFRPQPYAPRSSNNRPNPIVSPLIYVPPQPQLEGTTPPNAWQARRPPLTREFILERVAAVPQRPNTEEGKRQYRADVDAWFASYGTDTTPSLYRPFPLSPGTATPGSGECFECGVVTEPRHTGGNCEAKVKLPPIETKWRQIVMSSLRRASQMPASGGPAQTNHTWQNPQSAPPPAPMYLVEASHDEYGGEPQYGDLPTADAYQWDWPSAPEN